MSELSELYLSNTLKTFAVSLINIFVPIYLYDLGYSLREIIFFYLVFFMARPFIDYYAGYLVTRFGPKHVMRASYMMTLLALSMMVTLDDVGWPLWFIAVTQAIGWGFYWLSFHVDFSKIKHTKTEGKELGKMAVLTRIVSVLGPLAGGVLAFATSIQFVFLVAVAVMFMATIPLMLTPEPLKTKPSFSLKGVPTKKIWRDFISNAALGVDQVATVMFWPIFISLAVFEFNDAIYAKVGFVTSIAMIVGVLMIKAIGQMLDKNKGRELLHYSTMASALIHAIRPLAATQLSVVLINVMGEPVYNASRMSYSKGLYDRADSFGDMRIPYITTTQIVISSTRTLFLLVIWALTFHFEELEVLQLGMLLAALITPLVLLEGFPAFRTKK